MEIFGGVEKPQTIYILGMPILVSFLLILTGEMNAKLLKKIEELTLHLIEKEIQIDGQHLRLIQQENRMDKLEELIKIIEK